MSRPRGAAPSGPAEAPADPVICDEIRQELEGNLLPFWRERCLDREAGGFIGEMAHDGAVRAGADKGLVLNARLLWSFSALYRALGDERDRVLAERARDYLESRFADRRHGGYRWRVDAAGRPLDDTKKVYGQAFAIYALSELHRATGDRQALAAARRTWELVERHALDPRHGGYLEALAADWSATVEQRLSAKDLEAARSMNTHLHLVEAYANLHRAWPDGRLAERLDELLELFDRHILMRDAGRHHLCAFFDRRWRPLSDGYTYGHDIEAAWLVSEAARALGDERRRQAADRWARGLARSVLAEGVDSEGGLAYQGRAGEVTDPDREWWCQAEAVVGFRHAWQLTGDGELARASARVWQFISRRVVDRTNGEWFWRVRADGSVDASEPKVSEWKGPYHDVRMCLEMLRRLGGAPDGGER